MKYILFMKVKMLLTLIPLLLMVSATTVAQGQSPIGSIGVEVEVQLGKPAKLEAGVQVELKTPSGISVIVKPASEVNITITESNSNPKAVNPQSGIGIYITIEMSEETEVEATIAIPYGAKENAINNANNLALAFYSEAEAGWERVPSSVDIEAKVVFASTTHFSTWTVVESESSALNLYFGVFTALAMVSLVLLKRKNN
jgi:hypothetical protein